ncbi:MAG TPA: ABC transporter ATP-binding protein [Acidimicrobiia bacterium]|nr:ABC transporter ATP-binding protein [Acidimicrobiia bacterium]
MDYIVDVNGVGKTFEGRSGRVEALRDISLRIEPGDFVSLIGPSGCGKSTLLRLMADLLQPSAGTLLVNGKDPHQARVDGDYGIAFQRATLLDWRTVKRNVELPLELTGMEAGPRGERAHELLSMVGLDDFLGHYPWQLSGGMQQRVAIARSLVQHPPLLLMDEPFGALDEMTRESMQQELMRIWRDTGTTVIFVTHSIPEAVFLSTRVVVMSARPGRITDEIAIDLPQPRDFDVRESPRFFELLTEVREALRREEARS